MKRKTGEYVPVREPDGKKYSAFVPYPLPPDPPLDLGTDLLGRMESALLSIGRLDGSSCFKPDLMPLILYMCVRKEAVLSSQIEGTQSTLEDLLLFESEQAPGVPLEDVRQVSSYVAALESGLKKIRKGLPISLSLIRETHKILLGKGRGKDREPGRFRSRQVWIGGNEPGNAVFVPPPPKRVGECMKRLERFLQDKPGRTPVLLKAALAHGQFETIHPFRDGNGRVGRMLVTLLLCSEGVLHEPLLYLSLFLKRRRQEYYNYLQGVRTVGSWESWLGFFLEGIRETAGTMVEAAGSVSALLEKDRTAIQKIGKAAGSALRVHRVLEKAPIVSIGKASEGAGISVPAATSALGALQRLGVVREMTGKRRGRLYTYTRYLKILSEGTEPL